MKSILTNYDPYGNPLPAGAEANTAFAGNTRASHPQMNEPNFNDYMNILNNRSKIHDMRDLMKSLNNMEQADFINASRSAYNPNRSIFYGNEQYN